MQSLLQKVFDPFIFVQIFIFSLLIGLTGCHKQKEEQAVKQASKSQAIELIEKDVIDVKTSTIRNKVAFSGTIRAVNRSTIQSQVNATATTVNAQVGQKVNKNQILVVLNNHDNAARLSQAQANLATAEAQATQANSMVQRKKRLLDEGFISVVEYEQAQIEYKAQTETVNAQRANVEIAVKASKDGVIVSPIAGVITRRDVEPGQTVAAGQTIFEIVDPSQLELQARLPVEQQSVLRIGNKIEYKIQGSDKDMEATITRVSPIADQNNRQLEFFAKPVTPISSLSIGTFIEGNIFGRNKITGQIVPFDAVHGAQNRQYVWVIRENKIQQAYVQVLEQQSNSNIAVVEGLLPQDQVSRVPFTTNDINKLVSITPQ